MKAKLGILPRSNRAPLLFDGALPKFNALVALHLRGADRLGPAECMRPDYGRSVLMMRRPSSARRQPWVAGPRRGPLRTCGFAAAKACASRSSCRKARFISDIRHRNVLLRIVRNCAKASAGQNSWQEPACPSPPSAFAFVHPRAQVRYARVNRVATWRRKGTSGRNLRHGEQVSRQSRSWRPLVWVASVCSR
jgi:hypothetical protein